MRKSSFKDFDLQESISCGEYIPELDATLYASSAFDAEAGRRVNRIILKARATGEKRILTAGKPGEGNPRISPDAKKVLFLAVADGARQIFVYDLESDTAAQLTTMRFGCMEPFWSPDGEKILFTSMGSDQMDQDWLQTPVDPKEAAAYARERAKKPTIITEVNYKFDGLGFAQPEVMHLWVVSTAGGKAKRISSGNANFMHSGWASDSRHVLCESNVFANKENGIAMDVLLIDTEDCTITQVTKELMVVSYPNPQRPAYTPDGKWVIAGILDMDARKQMKDDQTYPASILHRISPDGQEVTPIFVKTDECFDSVQFPYNAHCGQGLDKMRVASDGKHVLFCAGSNGEARIWRVAIEGDDHTPVAVCSGKYAYNGMGVPKNGKVLVTRTSPVQPEAYYLLDEATGELELLVQSNEEWVENVDFSYPEEVFFKTLDGESTVHGFCLPPQGAKPGEKYPCILYVHGGPHPFYTYGFDLEMQCFAAEGFGMLYCNFRGTSGYGDKHRNLARAQDGAAYMDNMQFVDVACRTFDWIDADRIGMTGGSYGGYMTNYTAARSHRFKAYITQRCVANELIMYASTDLTGSSTEFKNFEEFMVDSIKRSCIVGMENVNAPFLILHGIDDYRCPVEGAHQLFVALKDSHAPDFPIKMILYPHLNHNQPSEPKQRQHYYKAMVDWFKAYV